MPTIQVPTGPVEISDPNHAPELFLNGPFNIIGMGPMVQIILTTVRPDTADMFKGNSNPKFRGIVSSRIIMPAEMAKQLAQALGQSVVAGGVTQPGTIGNA
jgi:hypothetical protein